MKADKQIADAWSAFMQKDNAARSWALDESLVDEFLEQMVGREYGSTGVTDEAIPWLSQVRHINDSYPIVIED